MANMNQSLFENFDENELICSITQEVPNNPVLGKDGHIYEKSAIENWLRKKSVSPITKEHMTVADIKVCPTIKAICDLIHSGKIQLQKEREKSRLCVEDMNSKTSIQKTANINGYPSAYSVVDNKFIFTFSASENSMYSPKKITDFQWSDLALCLDISYSTSSLVESRDENGVQIEGEYTINDSIRHGAKTSIYAIKNTGSRIAIYQFDDSVENVVPLTQVTDDNIDSIIGKIDSMKPRGATNIYKPIQSIIKDLSERVDQSRNPAILLLTDGVPNQGGSYSEEEGAVRLYKKLGVFYPIYTFGFGYSLRKKLLYNIAQRTGGVNSHIPDGSFVATVFSNALANILNTCCYNLRLHLRILNEEAKFSSDIVNSDYVIETCKNDKGLVNEVSILLGSLQFEQMRDIIVNIESNGPNAAIEYNYTYSQGNYNKISTPTIVTDISSFGNIHKNMEFEILRDYMCKMMGKMTIDRERGIDTSMRSLHIENHVKERNLEDSYSSLLMDTWTDQVHLANVSTDPKHRDYWEKWGWIYFDQLRSAITNQCSNNFKDKAYECFGGNLCRQTSDEISDIFDTIPNTEPTGHIYKTYRGAQPVYRSNPNYTAVPISRMNYSGNSCFTGDYLIKMSDENMKCMKDLRPGDIIKTVSIQDNPKKGDKFETHGISRVISILRSKCPNNLAKIVSLSDNCKVTEWHPVSLDGYVGSCEFPVNISQGKEIECDYVYSVELEEGKHFTVMDNGILGITLGCNLTEEQYRYDTILKHDFWGTENVRNCLKLDKNYPYVDIHPSMIVRNIENGVQKEVININI